jgi:L-fuculose-phosphate aldolase
MTGEKKLKIIKDIVEITHLMYERQMSNAYEGNVSIRKGNRVFVTPAGISKGIVTADMIVELDLEGNIIKGRYKPSSEVGLHLEIYKLRDDINSVIHNHAPYATAFAIARKPIETKAYPEMIILFDKVPLVSYGTPGTGEVYADLEKYIHNTDVFLLANHGVVAAGKDVRDAFDKLEAVEKTAKTLYLARQLGGEYPLDEEKIKELYEMRFRLSGKERML